MENIKSFEQFLNETIVNEALSLADKKIIDRWMDSITEFTTLVDKVQKEAASNLSDSESRSRLATLIFGASNDLYTKEEWETTKENEWLQDELGGDFNDHVSASERISLNSQLRKSYLKLYNASEEMFDKGITERILKEGAWPKKKVEFSCFDYMQASDWLKRGKNEMIKIVQGLY
jgi:hypothetical protein